MSTQSEHDRRAEIHARDENATKGPWTAGGGCIHPWEVVTSVDLPLVELPEDRIADAAFIAKAREDVPWLLDLAAEKDNALEEAGFELAAAQMERDATNAERDRLAADLRWEQTLRERVEGQLRQSSADNLAMLRQRDAVRAVLAEAPPGTVHPASAATRADLTARITAIYDQEAS